MSKLINVYRDKYSIIPNEVFTDRYLDYRAKGLLCTIFSLPNNWDFSILGLVELVTPRDKNNEIIKSERGEGKDAVRVSLQLLERRGYLERIPTKTSKGFFDGYDYKLNIPPVLLGNHPSSENPTTDKPTTDRPTTD